MKQFFMGAATCLALLATISLTSCSKVDDVNYSDSEDVILYKEVDGKNGSVPCVLCQELVLPLHYHLHVYEANACPLGTYCTHYNRRHWHIFTNGTTNATWFELTTHFGGTIPPHSGHIDNLNNLVH